MEPLLQTIAREYSGRYNNLKDICFLFPNKRCGIYLRKYFYLYDIHTEDLPHILTISEFVSQIAKKKEANKLEQIFTLYNCYLDVLEKSGENDDKIVEFENFKNWGETVLADFNTVDLNLSEPEEIFKNVKDFREITSNFLTEEQKEVMRDYFGIEETGDASGFWKNFSDTKNLAGARKKFLNLWQILAPLHKLFIQNLSQRHLGTAGSIFREAERVLKEKGREKLPYNKIVAVGFNALTQSERSIFKILMEQPGTSGMDDYIDFIWDLTGPVLRSSEFSASRFIDYNIKHFPMPEWLLPVLEREEVKDYPEVSIISAPSNTAQAKVAAEILKNYTKGENYQILADSEVAVILPDESLLTNLLYSLPDGIDDINLTMGYSMRLTPVASFVNLLRRLYSNMREGKKDKTFYSKDLKLLLSHPFSYILFDPNEISNLKDFIQRSHRITLTNTEISEVLKGSEFLFNLPGKEDSQLEIFSYLYKILDLLLEKIEEEAEAVPVRDIEDISVYKEQLKLLEKCMEWYKIHTTPLSILQMVDRLISNEKIGFEGEPLMGLQVMGTLETRTLDFKHVIILSMNEGIMPRKAVASTFLPDTLRKSYGLPPARYAEEIFAYYFYRLISRAQKVSLIYDGRAITGLRGGESRYLLQLRQYLPNEKLHEISWQYHLQSKEEEPVSIIKTSDIKEKLNPFIEDNEQRKNFSASSLNTYRECQIKFFMQNVLNLNSDPESEEFMDAISIGNVLHEVMMDLYLPKDLQNRLLKNPVTISKENINDLLENKEKLKKLIIRKINKFYYGDSEAEEMKWNSGVAAIMAVQIQELVEEILKHDRSLAPFRLFGCEISQNLRIKLPTGKTVNFRFAIDRLDEINEDGNPRLRIVDYKTGTRKREAESLEEVFQGGYRSEQIFQLFTYAWLLGKIGMEGAQKVITEIYYVPDMVKAKRGLPVIGGEEVNSFESFKEEFSERLEKMIESVFEDECFLGSTDTTLCSYCDFKNFCGKN